MSLSPSLAFAPHNRSGYPGGILGKAPIDTGDADWG